MTAYLIARVKVTDPARYENYKALSPGALAAFDGKFLVRGGAHETLEGEAEDRRLVLVEFPSLEQAKACYDSAQYQAAKAERDGAAEMQMVVVEGL
ncbi:DUF1330 domain-containing protein [Marivibrio halodurans]|uniref:DUF1330 domain-containing protein n=1 Tax=Marivibrio halodurans TaxID=2039722 RepID=A0A8J7V175_9PROT|nr:DUF1330 domain-containing protein [Marivibrio halodurans]MBP5856020.1 DUF1330 domain-containing protein [Marivibrio halodurans]